ncbi:MAG: N-acetyltransferase [Desulfobacteraceae bacterium]|nr:N-acetyltransferase [Desulfobacteraceae bacterium]
MIRKAMIKDIPSIHSLLRYYGEQGDMLARPLGRLYDHLRDFWVFIDEKNNEIVGCCALQFCWEDLAEIRSLAVKEGHKSLGAGTLLVDRCIQEAIVFNIAKLFVLTYQSSFFKKFDFKIVDRSELPIKIWSDCMFCVKFPDCDETAMIKSLRKE